jgi:thiol-disulfide isomerase/thioredoxin
MITAMRIVVGVAIAALAGAAGFFVYRQGANPSAAAAPAAAPASPAAAKSPRVIPDTLPAFTLVDSEGTARTLADWPDRPLLVNLWATWCAPCRREIPLLRELRREYAAAGLEVIGIAVDFREDVLKYAAEIGLDYPLLIGEEDGLDAVAAFGVEPMFPISVFSDRRGRIVAVRIGELHRDEAEFILGRVVAIDAGTLELAPAQAEIAEQLRILAAARATAEAAS